MVLTIPFPILVEKQVRVVPSWWRDPTPKIVMRISLCGLSFLLLSLTALAAPSAPIEHFIPAGRGVLFEYSFELPYLLHFRQTLIEPKTIAGRPILQVALLEGQIPEPESVLTLYDTAKDSEFGTGQEGGPYILEYRVAKEVLWERKSDHPVGFDAYHVDVSSALAGRMFRLWHTELAQTRMPAGGGRDLTPNYLHYCCKLGEGSLSGATPSNKGSDRLYLFDRAAMYAGGWIKPNPRSENFHQRFLRCLDQLEQKPKHLVIP